MRGIAEQRDAAVRPARQRIAVAHRIFPEFRRRHDQRLGVDVRACRSAARAASARRTGRAATSPPCAAARSRRRRSWRPPPSWSGAGRRARLRRSDRRTSFAAMPPATIIERPVRNSGQSIAPRHSMMPFQRAGPSFGIELLAHERMDAVGADQHVAMRGRAVRAVAVEEIGGDAALVLRETRRADGRYGCATSPSRARTA